MSRKIEILHNYNPQKSTLQCQRPTRFLYQSSQTVILSVFILFFSIVTNKYSTISYCCNLQTSTVPSAIVVIRMNYMNCMDSFENNTFFKNSGKRIGQSSLVPVFPSTV